MDDELSEDEDLVIPGETTVEDYAATESDTNQDDFPVRLLQDFTIYDMATNEAVSPAELMSLKYVHKVFGASGLVKPWIDVDDLDDDDDDEDTASDDSVIGSKSGERVKLSKLLDFDLHHYNEVTKCLDRFVFFTSCIYPFRKKNPDPQNVLIQ